MPALPLQGATREAEDDDDDEDGDDEDDEDDHDEEETENEHERRDEGPGLSQSRASFSSGRSYASGVGVDMQGPSSSSSTESSMFIPPRHHFKEGSKNANRKDTAEEDSDSISNSSAYETAPSAAPSRQTSRQSSLSSKSFTTMALNDPHHHDSANDHHLPPIDLGPTPGLGKLDLSFLNQPPMSASHKGKARMSLTEDAGRTPTAGRTGAKSRRLTQDALGHHGPGPGHAPAEVVRVQPEGEASEDYFRTPVVVHPRPHPHPYYRSMSEQTVQGGGGTRNISPSPSRTPRPGDHHHVSILSTPVGGSSFSASSRPSSSTGLGLPSFGMTLASSLSRSNSMMSQSSNRTAVVGAAGGGAAYRHANGNVGPNLGLSRASSLSRHSGMYSIASKSLIDVHALEKREEVERIVWEEEEKAERRMVKTRLAKGVYQDKEDGDGDGEFFLSFFFSFWKRTRRDLIINTFLNSR